MPKIELAKEIRDAMAQALSAYLREELDLEVKGFDAVFLLDFIGERLGPYFYNQGLYDAQAIVSNKADEVGDAILSLERTAKS